MIAKTVTVGDIKNLIEGKIVVQMPDFKSTVAARNQVSYARGTLDIPEGKELKTSTDRETFEFTVMLVDKADKKD